MKMKGIPIFYEKKGCRHRKFGNHCLNGLKIMNLLMNKWNNEHNLYYICQTSLPYLSAYKMLQCRKCTSILEQ